MEIEMIKKQLLAVLSLSLINISPVFAETVNGDLKASATIENSCLIAAENINFGQVFAPLTQQGTKSEMRVLCSKDTTYTIDLNYGGNFVDPNNSSSSGEYTVSMAYKATNYFEQQLGYGSAGYRVYKNGQPIGNGLPHNLTSNSDFDFNLNGDKNVGDFICQGGPNEKDKIYFRTQEAIDLLAPGSNVSYWVDDTNGICSSGKAGRVNLDNFNSFLGSSKNDKGAMIGAIKGNALAYQITLPGDITKPWIANVNSYQAKATGEFEKIEVNARIMPDSSTSKYPAQDSYFDTVTAVISY